MNTKNQLNDKTIEIFKSEDNKYKEENMKKYQGIFLCMVIFTSIIFLTSWIWQKEQVAEKTFPVLKGDYLGQSPPGMMPEIFAPGIASTGYNEHIAMFTPDGKELYFRILGAPHSVILFMKEEKGRWTKPQVAPFSGKYSAKCSLSPDGNKIAISMGSPLDGKGAPKENWQIWIAERTDAGWGEPKNLGSPVNSENYSVAYPTLSTNGNLYFYSENHKGGKGKGDIWMSKFADGRYTDLENLGDAINTEFGEVDPFIAPDESYLIFISNRPGGYGNTDIYISFRKKDGFWTKAENMGDKINTKAGAGCPSVSPDGKYLFFSSNRTIHKNYSETPITYEEKIKILNSPGNGSEDIYWVNAKIIEELKSVKLK